MERHRTSEAAERKRIGAEVARRMAAAGMKPADLAAKTEIDDSQMSKVLAGRVGLSLYSLGRVASALGCTRADILAVADAPAKSRRPAPARTSARAIHSKD